MKPYLSIVIPLLVLGLVFVGGSFLSTAIDSPQSKLDAKMQGQVELAQRLLNDYNAAAPMIEHAFSAAATRPVEIDPDAWQDFLQTGEDGKHPLASNRTVVERLRNDEQQVGKISRDISNLSGSEPGHTSDPGPSDAYGNVLAGIKANRAKLDYALTAVQAAIAMSIGEGEAEVRGANHPAPTRLEAILIHHKADLMRREAALQRARAQEDRIGIERLSIEAQRFDREIQNAKSLLVGGNIPRMGALPTVSLADISPAAKSAQEEAAKPQSPAEKLWILSKLIDQLPAKKTDEQPATDDTQPEEKAETPEPAAELAEADRADESADVPMETVPPLADRLAELQGERTRANNAIVKTNAEVQAITEQIQDLAGRLAAAEQKARDVELKMIDAEQAGVQGADSAAADAFSENYRHLSEQHRLALQEIATLKKGAMRNAKSVDDEPERILQSPLAPADPSSPMKPERGLAVLESELAAAKNLGQANQVWLNEVDRQIADLTARKTTIESRVTTLEQQKKQTLDRAQMLSNDALVAVAQAALREQEALDLLTGQGQAAAQRAQSAANHYQRRVKQFISSENPSDMPEKKLTEMAQDQYAAAGAATVKGDLALLTARIYAQQADDLKLHQQLLASMQTMNLPASLNSQQLPEGLTVESIPASATSVEEAEKAIQANLIEAAKYAKEALAAYTEATEASGQLRDFWAVHANIAAVHLLMAHLPPAEGDTEDHLAQARQLYSRVIVGREKRPEYSTYKWIAEGLKTASVTGAAQP